MLPPIDEESLVDLCICLYDKLILYFLFREKIKKLVKARDCYGLVFDKVELNKINMKKSQPNLPKLDNIDTFKDNLPLAISEYTLLYNIFLYIYTSFSLLCF